jgi:hypothetical protein
MAQTCAQCSRANPAEALYCHYDGGILPGHGHGGAGLPPALRPFPSPLVFPSGRTCLNFDQMLRCCHEEWAGAVNVLRQGDLEPFFAALGRADLAQAARAAARLPDGDRGLDQLLAKLPSQAPQGPQLQVAPLILDLGAVRAGEDRRAELCLTNRGTRLLYGSVTSDCLWLTLGDAPGAAKKVFQFNREQAIPVQVRGRYLRASDRPLEGQLSVESNAGSATVLVRASVPVQPFPGGVLAGARNPRQLVDRARAAPREAAALFDSGAVAAWYRQNGWPYPVPAPRASALDALKQFLKVLGLPDELALPAPAAPAAPAPCGPRPFPEGVLAGALTPRQLVDKARAAPARAAPLFDGGAVAEWYRHNGWPYPVAGPRASGVDAVYQFLQALGVTDPPAEAVPAVPAAPAPAGPRPFPEGVLAGALTPRQLVDKARAAPAQAAPLFDGGAVAEWYRHNGWPYPVQGPRASGLDAVYQFLQALGVTDLSAPVPAVPETPAPAEPADTRVSGRAIHLRGSVGESLNFAFEARAKGKGTRPVAARATTDQPWLGVGATRLEGDSATIVLLVPSVPDRPGETLHARVCVTVNDTKNFVVPVTLSVVGRPQPAGAAPAGPPP